MKLAGVDETFEDSHLRERGWTMLKISFGRLTDTMFM